MMRKIVFYAVLVTVLSLSLVLSVAAEKINPPVPNTLSAAGAVPMAPAGHASPPTTPATLVNDGSFENGPPPGSAWTEVTNSTCEWIGDWSGVWGAGAKDGTFDFWAGGYCGGTPASSSVAQSGIAVPATDNMLHFWIMSYRPDPDDPDLDQAYLQVNGVTVWTYDLIVANDTFPNWVEKTFDMSPYANQNVELKFGANSAGASTGNIRFDYISIGEPPPPPERCSAGYHVVTLWTEGFEGSFPPAGWTVANTTANCVNGYPAWNNTDPGARGNLTGGSGLFAIADSDNCGSSVSMNTEMWTPALNLVNYTDARVGFNLDYYSYSGTETTALDVSTDAGSTWANVHSWAASARGPRTYESPNLDGAGQNDVIVRWHYVAGWDWWWEVDDVTITACEPDTPTAVNMSSVEASPASVPTSLPLSVIPAAVAAVGAAWYAWRRRR